MDRGPRVIATAPDWTISLTPYGWRAVSRALTLDSEPMVSMTTDVGATSTTWGAEQVDDLEHRRAVGVIGVHLDEVELALDRGVGVELDDLEDVDQLVELLW